MSNFYGELLIRITSDTKGLSRGLQSSAAQTNAASRSMEAAGKKARVSWERVGLGMQNVGRTMTQFVTLPVAAGFAFAAYSGYKYSKTLLMIRNLTGLTAEQTERYGQAILGMSKYGVAPQKLAEAMYFVSSSGFEAAEALKVLDVAAKASASGMGDVEVMADVITSAINSYGHSALSAAAATDILMKTVEVGKAEPEQLASSLGRILPIANQLGVDFAELGGNVAALTLGGLSSAEAVTALRGAMVALVSPAKMSIERLKTMGLSYKDVTKSITDKGLLPTLKMLWDATDHNMLKMRELIPNVRATSGVMSLLGANYKKNLDVIGQVSHAQGKLNETFAVTSQEPIQKFNRAIASIRASFTKMGIEIMPTVADMVTKIGSLFESVGNLSPAWRSAIMQMGVFVAVAGPVIMISGSLIRSIALIRGALVSLSIVKNATLALQAFRTGAGTAAESVGLLFSSLSPLTVTLLAVAAAAATIYGIKRLSDWLDGTTARMDAMRKAAEAVEKNDSIRRWADRQFGGHLEDMGGNRFVFRPTVEGDTDMLAKWVKTTAAKARVATREANQQLRVDAAEGQKAYLEQEIKDTEEKMAQGFGARGVGPMAEAARKAGQAYIKSLRGELLGVDDIVAGAKEKLADLKLKDQAIVFKANIADFKDKIAEVKKKIKENAGKPHTVKMMLRDEQLRQKLADLRSGLGDTTKKSYIVRLQLRADNLNKNLDLAKERLAKLVAKGGGREGHRGAYTPEVSADITKLQRFIAKGEKRAETMKEKIEAGIPKLDANPDPALTAIQQVKDAVAALKDHTFTITTITKERERATGGIDIVKSPTRYLAGEGAGSKGEIAAFFPLNDPNRSASLLAQLNAMMGGGPQVAAPSQLSGDGGSTTNVNIVMPGGTTLVGTAQQVGDILAPHIARSLGIRRGQARRRR